LERALEVNRPYLPTGGAGGLGGNGSGGGIGLGGVGVGVGAGLGFGGPFIAWNIQRLTLNVHIQRWSPTQGLMRESSSPKGEATSCRLPFD